MKKSIWPHFLEGHNFLFLGATLKIIDLGQGQKIKNNFKKVIAIYENFFLNKSILFNDFEYS